ncbi:MAG: hypothetical protein M3Y56_12700 [Armatimonadota bacterium]|nr:hypothetical protein [Armatimonadota bacterium]
MEVTRFSDQISCRKVAWGWIERTEAGLKFGLLGGLDLLRMAYYGEAGRAGMKVMPAFFTV